MAYVTPILEFSRDPLSDTTPTWIDVTDYLVEATWGHGKSNDLDVPQAGSATFTLDNSDGRFTPEYASGAYHPDIRPLRRFRWRIQDGANTYDEGIWYVTDWGNDFSTDGDYHEVAVQCVDGFALLALDRLGPLDPAEAQTYDDVVMFDEPLAYWLLGEARARKGTKAQDATGNEYTGTYQGFATLRVGVEPPVGLLADGNVCYEFDGADDHVSVPFDADLNPDPIDSFTLEAWARPDTFPSATSDQACVAGSLEETAGTHDGGYALTLKKTATGATWAMFFSNSAGASTTISGTSDDATTGEWHHIVLTFERGTAFLYVNGARVAGPQGLLDWYSPNNSEAFRIARFAVASGAFEHFDGRLARVALYDKALSAERGAAHYQAGAVLGYAAALAGARVQTVVISDLWSETKVQAGEHTVIARRHLGQAKLDEVLAAVKAESPSSLFFFDGVGDPVYLGWEYKATGTYMTPQATFGDADGEVPYDGIAPAYDDAIFNEVIASREDGPALTATDTDSQAEFRTRTRTDETGLILADDADARNVGERVLAIHAKPQWRVASLELNGIEQTGRTQILTRQIGDLIRVKRRPHSPASVALDVVTHILGISKRFERGSGDLFCTWNLARGFNADAGQWRAGITGFSEAGATTRAG